MKAYLSSCEPRMNLARRRRHQSHPDTRHTDSGRNADWQMTFQTGNLCSALNRCGISARTLPEKFRQENEMSQDSSTDGHRWNGPGCTPGRWQPRHCSDSRPCQREPGDFAASTLIRTTIPQSFLRPRKFCAALINRRDAKFRRGPSAMIAAHVRLSAVNPDLIGTLAAAPPRKAHPWLN